MQKFDLYQTVTNTIIEALETGVAPWRKPWKDGKLANNMRGLPYNASSNRLYSGVNIALLWIARDRGGYESNGWMTYKQAQTVGGRVRKGEKGTMVVFWNFSERKTESGKVEKIPFLRYYTVFNAEQIDDLPEQKPVKTIADNFTPCERAEQVIADSKAIIKHGGNRAAYFPAMDFIVMPEKTQFKKPENYYSTILHELTHWTGHHSRLNRDFKGRFGDESYAFEELIAEMGSAFLCADLGIDGTIEDHASYLDSWIKVLKTDKKAIIKAASEASKAHKLITEGASAELEDQANEAA